MQETNPTATALQPWEDEDNPVPKRTKCIKCKTNPRRSETSDYCLGCWEAKEKERKARANGKGEKCKDCGINPAGVPGNIASPYCRTCVGKHQTLTPQARIDADRKEMSAKGELCTRCNHASPEPDEALCFKCKNHENKRKIKPGLKRMPESCMYGWMGDFCRKLNCPLDAAYPTALAIGAGYGVPSTTTVRTNLYTTLIGSKGTGKSVTIKRILSAWSPPAEIQVIKKYPGSEIGLIHLLGGKKHKDMDEQDFVPKPYLLVQDEMRATLGKVNIQNSALPNMFNQLFYQNDYGTASKQGHYECAAKLSMVGGLTCEDADEFSSVYGVETTTGMYDRMVFGVCPEEWDFNHEGWQPPTEVDGEVIRRRPKAVVFPKDRFNQIKAWRDMDYKSRRRLAELAERIAVVTAAYNQDDEVSEECMAKALEFVDWQESVRYKYRPSEMDSADGKCQQAIMRALERYESWIEWRSLCKKHNLHRHGATVLNRVKAAMIRECMIEEEYEMKEDGSRGGKTGGVRIFVDGGGDGV
jgi:hypothetical protein